MKTIKIGISNITLQGCLFPDVFDQLTRRGISGLEIAPTLVWDKPLDVPHKTRRAFRHRIEDYGMRVIGLQSLYYNRPDLQVFGPPAVRKKCLEHLAGMIRLCRDIGGRIVTFGAYKNRKRGKKTRKEARMIAAAFFAQAAGIAQDNNVVICFEPIAAAYGCDFATTLHEGRRLVETVGHPYFRLHLDTGSVILNRKDPVAVFEDCVCALEHIHINDPRLYPPLKKIDLPRFMRALKRSPYEKWVALEFLTQPDMLGNILNDIAKHF